MSCINFHIIALTIYSIAQISTVFIGQKALHVTKTNSLFQDELYEELLLKFEILTDENLKHFFLIRLKKLTSIYVK